MWCWIIWTTLPLQILKLCVECTRHVPWTGCLKSARILMQYFALPLNGSKYYPMYTFKAIQVLEILEPGSDLECTRLEVCLFRECLLGLKNIKGYSLSTFIFIISFKLHKFHHRLNGWLSIWRDGPERWLSFSSFRFSNWFLFSYTFYW